MRETAKIRMQLKAMVMAVAAMAVMVLAFGLTTIISHAEDAKVTASSVKIRAGADTGTEMIGGALNGEILPITGETTGADGYTWYQVTFEGGTKTGYVRSDLVQKVGSGTGTGNQITPDTPATPNTPNTPTSTPATEVTAVQPVNAKVTGEQVRVRSNASTSGTVVETVPRDTILTVTGTAQDSEGKSWYQVSFTGAGGQATGFVREDFVTLEGELLPPATNPVEPEAPEVTDPVEPEPTPPPEQKDYDTKKYEDGWYLMDYTGEQGVRYLISDLYESTANYKKLREEGDAQMKSMRIIMIILVVAVILLALTATLLFFKIRDMMDAAYFEEVEKETVRKRQGQRSSGKADMPTGGTGSRSGGSGQSRPAGNGQSRSGGSSQARPSGAGQSRPAGSGQARPSGAGQSRPAGSGQARPSGTGQSRPAGIGQARPSGTGQSRPAGSGQARPSGAGQSRPAGSGQARPAQQPAGRQQERPAARENPSGQARNFLADDDEFDFEYLNWDGEEEN